MVKRLKAMVDKKKNASGARLFDSALASQVKESAQQIWLAGMGAFAKAQAEGKQVFESLVKEGASLQKKTQGVAEEKFGEVTSKMTSMAARRAASSTRSSPATSTISSRASCCRSAMPAALRDAFSCRRNRSMASFPRGLPAARPTTRSSASSSTCRRRIRSGR